MINLQPWRLCLVFGAPEKEASLVFGGKNFDLSAILTLLTFGSEMAGSTLPETN